MEIDCSEDRATRNPENSSSLIARWFRVRVRSGYFQTWTSCLRVRISEGRVFPRQTWNRQSFSSSPSCPATVLSNEVAPSIETRDWPIVLGVNRRESRPIRPHRDSLCPNTARSTVRSSGRAPRDSSSRNFSCNRCCRSVESNSRPFRYGFRIGRNQSSRVSPVDVRETGFRELSQISFTVSRRFPAISRPVNSS